jgi:hypothetical protein
MNRQTVTQYYRKHRKAIVTAASGLFYGGGWSLGYLTSFDTASAVILVLATVVGGYDIARTAYHEVTNWTFGIKTLVTLAAIGAIVIGEYWEAAAVVFLFSLGSYLEGRTMRKTRTALQELLEMTPDTATVRREADATDGSEASERAGGERIDTRDRSRSIPGFASARAAFEYVAKLGPAATPFTEDRNVDEDVERREVDVAFPVETVERVDRHRLGPALEGPNPIQFVRAALGGGAVVVGT